MSLLLLFASSGPAENLVAYGGDQAVLYRLDFGTGVEFPGDVSEGYPLGVVLVAGVEYAGDVAELYEPSGAVPTGIDAQVVAFGGDASAHYPVLVFVYVDGVAVLVNADLVNRIRLWHYASVADLEAGVRTELDHSFARGWATALSDPGSWTCTLQNTDADLAAIDYGHYVLCELDGIGALLGIVEKMDETAIASDEEHGQVTVLAGRGVVAEWERAIVMPPTDPGSRLFADVRHFGWMSRELLDQAWSSGRRQWRQDELGSGYEAKHGTPLGWPDPEGWWIWSTPPTASPPLHDPGVSYFRNGFSVAAAVDVAIYAAADDAFEMWVDGVPVGGNGQLNGWKETFRVDVPLEAGEHVIAIRAENFARLASTNTAGLIVAVYSLDAEGNDDVLLLRTGGADWEVAHYPSQPPGFTVGEVLRLLLEDAQAEGELVGWTLDFDDAVDSAGNPWPPNEQFSFPAGLDLLAVLQQLADTHIDYVLDRPARILRSWRYGEAGATEAAAVADLTSGLGSLVFEGRA